MKKIVSVIKPFTISQNIFVYEDGNKILNFDSPLGDLQNNLLEIAKKYRIEEIDLIGSKKYCGGIKKQIQEKELSKYNENKLVINLING